MTRVLIADDHAVLRSGLRLLLNAQRDMEVVGEASDGEQAVAETARVQPDVVLLDLTMGRRGGLPAIRAIRDACERTKILVLTMHADPSYLRESLSAGCTGYVVKNMADTDLINAIRQVARGRQVIHFSSEESSAFATAYAESRGAAAEGGGRQPDAHLAFTALSPREREVFVFVARGFTNRDIATRLGLSVKSVETYRGRLMEKLGLENRAALVRLALQAGLLTPTEPNDADCRDLPVTDASS